MATRNFMPKADPPLNCEGMGAKSATTTEFLWRTGFALFGFALGALIVWLLTSASHGRKDWQVITATSKPADQDTKPPVRAGNQRLPDSKSKSTMNVALRERAKGNYILDLDIPWLRDRLEEKNTIAVEAIMVHLGPTYENLLDSYGITGERRAQILNHISQIYRAKVEAKQALTSLANAQADLETRMRKELGGKFDEYAAFEALDSARREISEIASFSERSGYGQLSVERLADIQELVNETAAFTAKTLGEYGGPFHESAPPRVGPTVVPFLSDAKSALERKAATLIAHAKARGFSEEQLGLLDAYYRAEIQRYSNWIADARDPLSVRRRQLEAEAVGAPPGTPAHQRIQMMLDALKKTQEGAGTR